MDKAFEKLLRTVKKQIGEPIDDSSSSTSSGDSRSKRRRKLKLNRRGIDDATAARLSKTLENEIVVESANLSGDPIGSSSSSTISGDSRSKERKLKLNRRGIDDATASRLSETLENEIVVESANLSGTVKKQFGTIDDGSSTSKRDLRSKRRRKLKLNRRGIDDATAARLSKTLENEIVVESANLSGNRMSHIGLEMLLRRIVVKNALNLSGNPIADTGVKVLSGNVLPAELNLQNCSIGDDGIEILAVAMHSSKLKRLNLRRNNVTDLGASKLASAIEKSPLDVLNISGNPLTGIGRSCLGRAAMNTDMNDLVLVSKDKEMETKLNLSNDSVVSVSDMRRTLKHRSMGLRSRCGKTFCDLRRCDLNDQTLLPLLDIVRKMDVTKCLDLSGNDDITEISLVSVEKLVCEMPSLTRVIVTTNLFKIASRIRAAAAFNELKRIASSGDRSEAATFRSAGHRDLGDIGTANLIRCLASSKEKITHLGLHHNDIGEDGCIELANYLNSARCNVSELAVYGNRKGEFWGKAFESVLAKNNSLLVLDLGSNGIGDEGVRSLARGLARNNTLRELHLDFCNISKRGLTVLTDLMQTNHTVTRLWLHGNCFQDKDMSSVMRYVSRNQDQERLHLARVSGLELSEKDRRVVRASHLEQRFRELKHRGHASVKVLERAFREDVTNNSYSTISSRLGVVSARTYMKMCPDHCSSFRGDIVLSSIVVEHIPSNKLAVVAFAVGTKYLSPSIAQSDRGRGEIVRDSHAEVLTRRAFCLFLYTQIASVLSDDDDDDNDGTLQIFRRVSKTKQEVTLCSEFRFHLYVSTAPCGGCSIPTKHMILAKSLDSSRSTGGCVSQAVQHVVGDPSVRLSCTNKLVRWCYLGFQGHLLSYFIPRPIRVANVAIGRKFDSTRCKRCVADVLQDLRTASPHFLCVPSNASVETLCDRLDTSREKGGDGDEVIWWCASESEPSRLDGRVGRPLRGHGTSFNCSKISSIEMLLNFHALPSDCISSSDKAAVKSFRDLKESTLSCYSEKRRKLIRFWDDPFLNVSSE